MRSYLRYTFGFALRQKKRLVALSLLIVLITVTRIGEPYLYKIIVDTLTDGIVAGIFHSEQARLIVLSIILWALLAFVTNIGSAQIHFLTWKIGNISSQYAHLEGYRRLLRLDYQEHTRRHSSKYAKIIDDADVGVWEMTNWWLGRFVPAILGFCTMLAVAFTVSVPMTLIALSVIPPDLAIVIFMIKKYEDRQRYVNKLWKEKHEHMADQLANIVTYKLNQNEQLFLASQKAYSNRASKEQTSLNKKWRIAEMLNPDAIVRFVVLTMGIFLVFDRSITLGTLFMFMGLLGEILTPLHILGDILPQYSRRARDIERQIALLEKEDKVIDVKRPYRFKKLRGAIDFQNVIFRYNKDIVGAFAIDDVSLSVQPGQHVALVGHSGSGKSTIMGLVTRLMDVDAGAILIDGVDIRSFRKEDLMGAVGVVLQENSLYDETVARNVAYGKPHATRQEIVQACRRAAAHEFIKRMPAGYETVIGERGVRLSGGEKQRIAIARAILKNPDIVVLDEPTSALDSITEAKVQRGLDELIKNRTAIVIAHRLSTVRNADKIIVLSDGRIIGEGTHSELLRTCSVYNDMVQLQTGGFLADE